MEFLLVRLPPLGQGNIIYRLMALLAVVVVVVAGKNEEFPLHSPLPPPSPLLHLLLRLC